MKRLKILVILIITITAIILIGSKANVEAGGEYNIGSAGNPSPSGAVYYKFGIQTLVNYNNVYCVAKDMRADEGRWYLIQGKARVIGDDVYFQRYDAHKGIEKGPEVKGNSGIHNRILGAILFASGDPGYGWKEGEYTESQRALYDYWGTWVYVSRANLYGFNSKGHNGSGDGGSYKDIANTTSYNYTIYFVRAIDRDTGKFTDSKYQNMMVAYYEGGGSAPSTEITVIKKWENDTPADRPANGVAFDLFDPDGNIIASMRLPRDGTVNGNEWTGTFTDISAGAYTVVERDEGTLGAYSASGGYESDNTWTFTNTLPNTAITVRKTWNDDNNRDGKRPTSVRVRLYENGTATNTTATLSASNNWTWTFSSLPKYKNNTLIKYTVQEDVPTNYTVTYSGNGTTNVAITNTYVPERINVTVKKAWNDMNDLDDVQPKSITVTLYKNGTSTGQTVTLSANNNWTASFNNIYKYENGKLINYTVKENTIPRYTDKIDKQQDGKGNFSYTITNTHTPKYTGYIEISGKAWLDGEAGKASVIDGIFNTDQDSTDKELPGIKVILKDANGQPIKSTYTDENGKFTRTDYAITDEHGNYTIRVNYDNSQNVYKLYENQETIKTKLQTGYVEFEYDGMTYTTVGTATTGETTSKAKENEVTRNAFDSNHSTVTPKTAHPDNWTDKNMTASTKDVISFKDYQDKTTKTSKEIIKYCNGNGTYKHTNIDNAWDNIITGNYTCQNCAGTGHMLRDFDVNVEVISNVNIGLFKREQPDVAIFSDLTKVEVEMNSQKYTYLYGVRSSNLKAEGNLQAQFQNKDTYTYRRPVNPADIAYIQEPSNSNKMKVKVTYEVKVANLSSTLVTTINSISNYFDSRYTLTNTSEWSITQENGFNKATPKRDLNITLEPEHDNSSSPIVLTYEVSLEAIRDLLNKEATLNNAVEIESYSTLYGAKTAYAEQRTGGRNNQPYGGYDYNSHPGDANIKLIDNGDGVERLYSTDKSGNIILPSELQDDTDIAPSFVLCKDDELKALSGVVWEDSKSDKYAKDSKERLGDGHRDDNENRVKNVKIELVNSDGSTAKLYNENTKKLDKDAVIYTDSNGNYKLEGLVTGEEYSIKYIYGNKQDELEGNTTTISENGVNARNYKSTIITGNDPDVKNILEKENLTDTEKMWPITHNERYSVAVDSMKDRLNIGILKNSTYNEQVNMNAYTKTFVIPLEFTLGSTGQSSEDGKDVLENGTKIEKVLNKFDFGIIERPREDLIVQKTVSHLKITLSNGQLLLEGDPRSQNLNYTKAIGLKESTSRSEIEKRILVEIDSELTQGAQLEATYAVKVINNNEIDYDYGQLTDYNTDGYIARGARASYYYYGEKNILEEMKSTIKFVDYLDSNLVYKEDTNTWKTPNGDTVEQLKQDGYIDNDVYNELKKGGYNILQTSGGIENGITIKRGEYTEASMTTSRVLAIRDDNTFNNHAEIIEIDGKTARTIKGKDEQGKQIEYIPGNYTPSEGPNEFDDDSVKIIITPPTGITNYVITYIIAGLAGMIIIIVGIVFIKKKVLI